MSFPTGSAPIADADNGGLPPAIFFDARQTVISQYANSPIMLAIIQSFSEAVDQQANIDRFYDLIWNVETAQGYGLDVWGRIVGVSRVIHIPTPGDYLGYSEGLPGYEPYKFGVWYNGDASSTNFLLTDDVFRRVILAKAALNITDGSIQSTNLILMALFPGYGNVFVVDNEDMTMIVRFSTEPSVVDLAIANQANVLPKPTGVSLSVDHL
jgi:hypothetical protein